MPAWPLSVSTVLVGRYVIERELGHGGMATVYLARDQRHQRLVAIKALRPELSASLGAERFLREVAIAANLHHPHLLPVYDSGEAEGVLFYVMPCVEGESLRDRLTRERQLPVEDALRIASEVADALTYAHAHDVLHRDIKPENVLLESGHAMVTDFGVARAISAAGVESLTGSGISVGTPQYMSPEQASGEHHLDGRSDVYALGCVVYEMLTGQAPFTGPTVESVVRQHIAAEPLPASRFRPMLSPQVDEVLHRALAKAAADRYATPNDLVAALRAASLSAKPAPVAAARGRRRVVPIIATVLLVGAAALWATMRPPWGTAHAAFAGKLAVLPFENLGAPEDEYFADGVTEEITARLASGSLPVISRTSVLQYKKHDKTIKQIAGELGADYILEGTIRWQKAPGGPARVRVTPQLIRVSDDTHLWAHVYDEVMTQVFDVQSEIAENVNQALGIALSPRAAVRESPPTQNLEAYDYYLRGIAYRSGGFDVAHVRLAEPMLRKAVELDSGFGVAWARWSRVNADLYWYTYDRRPERCDVAKDAAERAIRAAPENRDSHMALGQYFYHCRLDYESALREFDSILKRNPNDNEALAFTGYIRRRQGRWSDAIALLQRAFVLDPRAAEIAHNLGESYVLTRAFPEGERWLQRANELQPEFTVTYANRLWEMMYADGGTARARRLLGEVEGQVAVMDDPNVALRAISIEIFDRRYDSALVRLRASRLSMFGGALREEPRAALYGQVYTLMHQADLARANYESARSVLEEGLAAAPNEPLLHSALGLVYAGLGRGDDALHEGRRAVDLLPISRDAYFGTSRLLDLARIHAMLGQQSEAIALLEQLLAIPSEVTPGLLRLDPDWDPLRTNPRFQRLLKQPG